MTSAIFHFLLTWRNDTVNLWTFLHLALLFFQIPLSSRLKCPAQNLLNHMQMLCTITPYSLYTPEISLAISLVLMLFWSSATSQSPLFFSMHSKIMKYFLCKQSTLSGRKKQVNAIKSKSLQKELSAVLLRSNAIHGNCKINFWDNLIIIPIPFSCFIFFPFQWKIYQNNFRYLAL